MIHLTQEDIALEVSLRSKAEAFEKLAALMEACGYVQAGYSASMAAREKEISTYMDNGVAVPHGIRSQDHLIRRTGVVLMTLKTPLVWNEGEPPVRVLFGLAAKGKDQVEDLKAIAAVFGDAAMVDRLAAAKDSQEALAVLEAAKVQKPAEKNTWLAGKTFVGVTGCPTGIAHTYMARDSLKQTGERLGAQIHVETQGSGGAADIIPPLLIAQADAVIIAADIHVETSRFGGKRVLVVSTNRAIRDAEACFKEALSAPVLKGSAPVSSGAAAKLSVGAAIYKHLMGGVSHMLPFVVAGGILIALAFAFGGIHAGDAQGTLGAALMQIGGGGAFALMVPFLAAYIAYSIADRSGLTPGAVSGLLAVQVGAGFIGGIIGGFVGGYLALYCRDRIHFPPFIEALKPVIITPLLSVALSGLLMIYVIGEPSRYILDHLKTFLTGMQGTSAMALGLVIGIMMGADLGGPINKAAYTFSVGLIGSEVYEPIAMAMAAGMVPPMAITLARYIAPSKFTAQEKEGSIASGLLGLSFITEGAIPYTAADPVRMIPSNIVGAGVAGLLAGLFACQLRAPHGGIFVVAIPHAVTHPWLYIVAIAAGVLIQAAILAIWRKRAV